MHTDCPDFDLCSACESHPIALHPDTHPLLKLKTPESAIPKACDHERSASSVVASGSCHEPISTSSAQNICEMMPRSPRQFANGSFIWGFRHGQSASGNFDHQGPLTPPPRLDEISPPICCTAQGSRPLPVPPHRAGHSINETHVATGVQDDNGRQTASDHGGDVHSLEGAIWPCKTGLERLMKAVSIADSEGTDQVCELTLTCSPPMSEEALLKPPSHGVISAMEQKPSQPVSLSRQTLAMLLSGYSMGSEDVIQTRALSPEPLDEPQKLSAKFIHDVTVSDGQVFPPGAEFVKCWRIRNDGGDAWPETTELVHVAGETLGVLNEGAVHVGAVKGGMEVELWTRELKVGD